MSIAACRAIPIIIHHDCVPSEHRIRTDFDLQVTQNVSRGDHGEFADDHLALRAHIENGNIERGAASDRRADGLFTVKAGEIITAADVCRRIDEDVCGNFARIPVVR